ncbi:ribonuclease 3 [Deltaproteobacteria bacterium]|nr:ribonuclease 3 [Deltaproteobacteria bacterium]
MPHHDATQNAVPDDARAALEQRLTHVFSRPALLALALTHSSFANESGGGQEHNERLEFLGDAVLELCVSTELFRRFPAAREGELTAMRSKLISAAALAARARALGLDTLVMLGRGEENQGGRNRDSVLSDVLEAVVAAVYEDGGFAAACAAVGRIFAQCWPRAGEGARTAPDYKTRLQEITLRLCKDRPIYARRAAYGPEHAKIFEVALRLPDGRKFLGSGTSCKRAEQDAACNALAALENANANVAVTPASHSRAVGTDK